jgi:hypothetical protein
MQGPMGVSCVNLSYGRLQYMILYNKQNLTRIEINKNSINKKNDNFKKRYKKLQAYRNGIKTLLVKNYKTGKF